MTLRRRHLSGPTSIKLRNWTIAMYLSFRAEWHVPAEATDIATRAPDFATARGVMHKIQGIMRDEKANGQK